MEHPTALSLVLFAPFENSCLFFFLVSLLKVQSIVAGLFSQENECLSEYCSVLVLQRRRRNGMSGQKDRTAPRLITRTLDEFIKTHRRLELTLVF